MSRTLIGLGLAACLVAYSHAEEDAVVGGAVPQGGKCKVSTDCKRYPVGAASVCDAGVCKRKASLKPAPKGASKGGASKGKTTSNCATKCRLRDMEEVAEDDVAQADDVVVGADAADEEQQQDEQEDAVVAGAPPQRC